MKKNVLLAILFSVSFIIIIGNNKMGISRIFGGNSENAMYEYENILCEKILISEEGELFWCNPDFLHTHTFLGSNEEKLVIQVSRKDDMLYAYLVEHDDRSWHFVFVRKGVRIGKERYTAIKVPMCETKTNIRAMAKTKTQFDDFYVVFKKR